MIGTKNFANGQVATKLRQVEMGDFFEFSVGSRVPAQSDWPGLNMSAICVRPFSRKCQQIVRFFFTAPNGRKSYALRFLVSK